MELNYLKGALIDLEYDEALEVDGGTPYAEAAAALITIIVGIFILPGDPSPGGGGGGGVRPPEHMINSTPITVS